MKFLNQLKEINKLYFTTRDLQAIGGYNPNTLYVVLNRLVKEGKLIRLTSGIYILPERYGEIERIANSIYFPSYLSFESALAKYGIISQIPYTLMFATPLKTRTILLDNYRVEYRSIKEELFFGYTTNPDGLLIATPEKALFDMIYLSSFGKINFDFQAINKSKIDLRAVKLMIKRYLPQRKTIMSKW